MVRGILKCVSHVSRCVYVSKMHVKVQFTTSLGNVGNVGPTEHLNVAREQFSGTPNRHLG